MSSQALPRALTPGLRDCSHLLRLFWATFNDLSYLRKVVTKGHDGSTSGQQHLYSRHWKGFCRKSETAGAKPTGKSDFSILEVRHENNLGIHDRAVYHPVFLCVRYCMRLRCDPGDLARLRTQPAAGNRESCRAKPGHRGRSFSQQFLFLNSHWRLD